MQYSADWQLKDGFYLSVDCSGDTFARHRRVALCHPEHGQISMRQRAFEDAIQAYLTTKAKDVGMSVDDLLVRIAGSLPTGESP